MKKSILNIGKTLNNVEQKEILGGRLKPVSNACADICPNAAQGTNCGPPHCPVICDGNGGWINI